MEPELTTATQLAFPGSINRRRLLSTIGTVYYKQDKLLRDALRLHTDGRFDLDPTYGLGTPYKSRLIPKPELRMDIAPRRRGVIQADFRALPLANESVLSVFFDPPFLAEGGRRGIMHKRYTTTASLEELVALYRDGLRELARILEPYGVIVFKCQDSVHDHFQVPYLAAVVLYGMSLDLYAKDLFVLVNHVKPGNPNVRKQRHARKHHAYFVVLQKNLHYAEKVRDLLGVVPFFGGPREDQVVQLAGDLVRSPDLLAPVPNPNGHGDRLEVAR